MTPQNVGMTMNKQGPHPTPGPSTKDVAQAIGVKVPTLLKWVREGLLSPASEGEGSQRRISWSLDDVAEAKALVSRGGRSSVTSLLEELAPAGVIPHLVRAQALRESLTGSGQVIIVGERGPRVFQADTPIGKALEKVSPGGGGLLLLLP